MSRLVLLGLALVLVAAGPVPSSPPDATTARRGLINTAAQSFAGLKTFDGGVVADLKTGSTAFGFEIQTATTAALTLYVDPTGSDSNACTASGTSACLTLAGALGKLPRFINHTTTINIAAGSYSENFDLQKGLTIARGIAFSATGVMGAFGVATGMASGTTTDSAAGGNSGPPTFTDSAQTWTTNDLRGAFVQFTSGAQSGSIFPIYANTATVVTYSGLAAAGTGSTYSIIKPTAIFTNAGSTAGRIANMTGAGTISISNVAILRTGGSGVVMSTVGQNAPVTLTNVSVNGSSGNTFAFVGAGGEVTFNKSYLGALGAAAAMSCHAATTTGGTGRCSVASSVVRATGNGGVFMSGNGTGFVSSGIVEGGSTTQGQVNYAGSGSPTSTSSLWIYCTGGSSSIGLSIGGEPSGSVSPSFTSLAVNGGLRITECGTGIRIHGGSRMSGLQLNFDTVTTAIGVDKGGSMDLLSSPPSFTGVTNELQLDGVNYTYATLAGMAAPKVLSNVYGSTIIY